MATITVSQTDPPIVITPILILSYGYRSSSSTVVHDPIHGRYPTVTLRPVRSRRGTLRCLFSSYTDVLAAVEAASTPGMLHFQDAGTSQDILFVVHGDISVQEIPGTNNWTVDIEYREVDDLVVNE